MTAVTLASLPRAGTQMPVRVSQVHIGAGKPEDACECPLALAITDAVIAAGIDIDDTTSVSVMYGDDGEYVSARVWIAPGAWLRLTLGLDAYLFMRAVDASQPAEPCTLTAEVA